VNPQGLEERSRVSRLGLLQQHGRLPAAACCTAAHTCTLWRLPCPQAGFLASKKYTALSACWLAGQGGERRGLGLQVGHAGPHKPGGRGGELPRRRQQQQQQHGWHRQLCVGRGQQRGGRGGWLSVAGIYVLCCCESRSRPGALHCFDQACRLLMVHLLRLYSRRVCLSACRAFPALPKQMTFFNVLLTWLHPMCATAFICLAGTAL